MAVIIVDENNKRIFFSEYFIHGMKYLLANEAFQLFVRKTGTYLNYEIDPRIEKIKFMKRSFDLRYRIQLDLKKSLVSVHVENGLAGIEFPDLEEILKSGYFIYENVFYPLNPDSIIEIQALELKDQGGFFIDTYVAIKILNDKNLKFIDKDKALNVLNLFKAVKADQSVSKLFTKELYPYQKEGVAWLQFCFLNKIGTILGDDMGLGKTAQVIALISWLVENGLVKKILIVVPGTLLENWKREFSFFCPSIMPHIHHGNLRVGVARGLEDYQVVITSYSLIVNDIDMLNKLDWDLVTLDEASLIKNPESDRTKAIKKLNSRFRIAMTGTPVENSLIDLWSLIDFVFPGYLSNLDEFRANYIGTDIANTLANDLGELRNKVSQIMIRRMKKDLLGDLPDRIDIHEALKMSDFERSKYSDIQSEIRASHQANRGTCFELINILRQFTSHPFLISEAENNILHLPRLSVKFERTIEILDQIKLKQEKVLIFTSYIEMIDLFHSYLADKYNCQIFCIDGRVDTSERQLVIDQFSKVVGFSVLVLNPTTAAVGLNITSANHVIHYTRQWNPALELQASARAYRNGQKRAVNIYYLYYADSIEEIIDRRLRQKEELAEEIITPVAYEEDELQSILDIITK